MTQNGNVRYIKRKTLLYKTDVEYGDYSLNHVLGCSHGCLYPCYAMMMAKRFGRVGSYEEWIQPQIVENALDLLRKEIPKLKDKINSVHFCFTTDPFMYGYKEIEDLTLQLIEMLNQASIKCTVLTKGCLPVRLAELGKENEVGITLISLNEQFRKVYEPFSASYKDRIDCLRTLHDQGLKTWVSIEPYPTPNIVEQDFIKILESVSFVDKIIFGKLNYNSICSKYPNRYQYYNQLSQQVIDFCQQNNMEYHIKKGTISNSIQAQSPGSKSGMARIANV